MADKKPSLDVVRKSKTFFHLIFPTVIIALIPSTWNGEIWLPLVLKVLVFFWQYIALKNFIDSAI